MKFRKLLVERNQVQPCGWALRLFARIPYPPFSSIFINELSFNDQLCHLIGLLSLVELSVEVALFEIFRDLFSVLTDFERLVDLES